MLATHTRIPDIPAPLTHLHGHIGHLPDEFKIEAFYEIFDVKELVQL